MRPRTFELVRFRDLSGVSGTGVVAEGCVFTDGSVALRWRGNNPATAVWPDLESVLAVHGHQGATEVQWLEPEDHPTHRHLTTDPRLTPDATRTPDPLLRAEPEFSADPRFPVEPHVSSATRLTPRPRPTGTAAAAAADHMGEPSSSAGPGFSGESELAGQPRFAGDGAFAGEPGFGVTPEGWVEPEGWSEPVDEAESEFDLEELLGGQHQVRPPSSIADPSGLPSAHARGWAAARHLR